MTDKEVFSSVKIELDKENLPVMLLEQFNYFANKGINQYTNKRYNVYDTSQQVHDDLANLHTTINISIINGVATMEGINPYNPDTSTNPINTLGNPGEYFNTNSTTPADYNWGLGTGLSIEILTIDNSDPQNPIIATSQINSGGTGYQKGEVIIQSSTSASGNGMLPINATITILTIDKKGSVLTYTIANDENYDSTDINKFIYFETVNKVGTINIINTDRGYLIPLANDYFHLTNCTAKFTLTEVSKCGIVGSTITKAVTRLPNGSYNYILNDPFRKPSIERPYYKILDGINKVVPNLELIVDTSATLSNVTIDYLRKPTKINLTSSVLNNINNDGTVINFPDYVVREIINEITTIYLEHTVNPRLQTQPTIGKSII